MPLLLLSALMQQARRTAEELRASREQYRSVVEDQTEMICRFRPDGTYTFVNSAYAAFFGREPGGVRRRQHARVAAARSVRRDRRARIAAVTRESPLITQEVAGQRRRSRAALAAVARSRASSTTSGNIVEYQCVGRDVTDRAALGARAQPVRGAEGHRAHAARRRSAQGRVPGHARPRAAQPAGAGRASRSKLLRAPRPLDAKSGARALDVIGRQFAHMTRLVDDLLDVSRIKRGTIELRLEPRRPARRRGAAASKRPSRCSHRAPARSDRDACPREPLWVHGDATRLAQVVGNLLHNAAKYTEPGGHIEVSRRRASEADAIVRVRDDGIGIPQEMLAQHLRAVRAGAEPRRHACAAGSASD